MMNILYTPVQIGTMTVKNRFVRSATQDWYGNEDDTVSERQIKMYEELAANEVGLIISAHAYVEHPRGRASLRQNGIYDDRFIAGFARLAKTVQAQGARLVVQVAHCGPQSTPELVEGLPLANPDSLTVAEIEELIENFAAAVARTKAAGCDGAQIHMAHGYLIARFLSPDTNHRQDEWGGSLAGRMRFALRIVKETRRLVGREYPLLVKINSCGGFAGTAAMAIADVVAIARALAESGVDAIEVSGGVGGSETINATTRTGIIKPEDEAYFAVAAAQIKQVVTVPVILVGGLRSRSVLERVVNSGIADLTALCRPFICEPDLVKKMAVQERVKCVSCSKCRDFQGIQCVLS